MLRVVAVITVLMSLIACSSAPEWKGNYDSDIKDKRNSNLEVPPELSEPDLNKNFDLPNIATEGSTYSAYNNLELGTQSKVAAAAPKGVKVIRDGATQWLEINMTADKLWPKLKLFFAEVGFEVKREDKALGVMETNFLENRLALPTNWFSKILNRISSTGLRDKYRARIEKTQNPQVSRVFITHQGLKEFATDTAQDATFKLWWEARPSDPELEAEMYQRFLIFNDISKEDSIKLVNQVAAKERTRLIDKDETKVLEVGEGFSRTWRRVGIALDRIGLFVEDRNRSTGLYYLRITDDFRVKVQEDKSWLSSLFSSDENTKLKERYLLSVSEEGAVTVISLYEPSGAKADAQFVKQLLSDLKLYLN